MDYECERREDAQCGKLELKEQQQRVRTLHQHCPWEGRNRTHGTTPPLLSQATAAQCCRLLASFLQSSWPLPKHNAQFVHIQCQRQGRHTKQKIRLQTVLRVLPQVWNSHKLQHITSFPRPMSPQPAPSPVGLKDGWVLMRECALKERVCYSRAARWCDVRNLVSSPHSALSAASSHWITLLCTLTPALCLWWLNNSALLSLNRIKWWRVTKEESECRQLPVRSFPHRLPLSPQYHEHGLDPIACTTIVLGS